MNNDIKKYIDRQPGPQAALIKKIRRIFLTTLPQADEKMAWGVITFAGKKFYLAALKDHVNIGFAVTGLSKDEIKLFSGSGKTMKHIEVLNPAGIDEKKLIKLIKLVNKKAVCAGC